MSYTDTANVPRLTSFVAARDWFEKTPPIRGNTEKVRPLGRNRRYWKMSSISMPDANTVHLEYYGQVLVEWRSDDSYTVFPPRWYNYMVAKNAYYYLPTGGFYWGAGRAFVKLDGKHYHLSQKNPLNFQLRDGKYIEVDPPEAYSYRAKRGAVKKLSAAYAPFLDWLQVVLPFNQDLQDKELDLPYMQFTDMSGAPSEDYLEAFAKAGRLAGEYNYKASDDLRLRGNLPFRGKGYHKQYTQFYKPACELLYDWVTSPVPAKWTGAMYVLVKQTSQVRWVRDHVTGSYDGKRKLSIEDAMEYLEELTAYIHRDVVFTKVKLEQGQYPSKRNANYFEDVTFHYSEQST